MRIAYIAADWGTPVFGPKGASVHIRSMVNAFTRLGHRVVVYVTRRGTGDQPLDADVIEVPKVERALALASAGESGTAPKERWSAVMASEIAARVADDHRRTPFDFIYERYALFSAAGVDCGKRIGIPCVVEVNAPLIEEQQQHRALCNLALAEQVRSRVFTEADALLPVSDALLDYCIANGSDPARVSVVPNGIDAALFNDQVLPLAPPALEGKTVVGFCGSLKPWHGLELLLQAFRTIAVGWPERHLLIVGEGPMRGWIEGFAAGAGIGDQVTITGWVPLEQVPAYIRRMDVAVAPYPPADNFYFSPLKLFEYLAVGTPVVASRIGQIETSLRDGIDALLVRPGDPQQLVEALLRLLGNPALRQQLAAAGATTGRQRTWDNNARRVAAIAHPLLRAG